ncbi:di-heme-cytochrome C peroxidase [Candidatus Methylospira mobilis]|uniref:di-heme-cytochrome C peroxidase n=1 Tax=Candidatus Methylospira mobilis TaxID=1808979 RepID=UPI0028E3CA8A|nr:di-heme-cytochrome C peroxidase [Candidatus Methylospira mobilis]WNV04662.1 di-heme-cytochrome C peroxidase [Candidatus Methylospira mobilis]
MIWSNKISRKVVSLHAIATLILGLSGNVTAASYAEPYISNKSELNADNYNQNWDQTMRELFYYTPQGSRLMPYKWFLALEQPNSETKFADSANIARFGLIYDKKSERNPDGLPIGFSKDPARLPSAPYSVNDGLTGPWVGMSCAACHTNDITYKGKIIRIDGAPTLADIGAFFQALSDAVKATRPMLPPPYKNPKFDHFAEIVYGHVPSEEELAKLSSVYLDFATRMEGQIWMRTPPSPAGAGRIDALGQIINALAVFDLKEPDNLRPPSAPVSYPHLWIAPDLDFVQWVPVAGNPISRNAGEVLGVFGETTFINPDPKNRLHSSVLLKQVYEMEEWLKELNPPPWREDLFGRIDTRRASAGKQLFDRDCRSCHSMPPFAAGDMTDPKENMKELRFIKVTGTPLNEVGTDPSYTTNLLSRLSVTGTLAPVIFKNTPIVPGAEMFLGSVAGVVGQAIADQNASLEDKCKYSGYRFTPDQKEVCDFTKATPGSTSPGVNTIKAGPLLGIWATGPFLHNGSVPNIYELLSAPAERSRKFWVGSHELDTVNLGFVSGKQGNEKESVKLFEFDTSIAGNSNSGHVYPKTRAYTHQEKMDIIEYLKQDSTGWRPNAKKAKAASNNY